MAKPGWIEIRSRLRHFIRTGQLLLPYHAIEGPAAVRNDAGSPSCQAGLDPYGYQHIRPAEAERLEASGKDRSATALRMLPEDLSGKSVLDIGCGYGFFCFEAAARGAARIVGIDAVEANVQQARHFAAQRGIEAEFRHGDLDETTLDEPFDYVICFNLLHFLRNPMTVLDRIAGITREALLLEIAGFGWSDRRNLGISALRAALLERSPVVWIARPGPSGIRRTNHHYISNRAVENFLVYQGRGFASVKCLGTAHKQRKLLIARKRCIGDLIVVSGPAGGVAEQVAGRLASGELPEFWRRSGFDETAAWTCHEVSELIEHGAARIDHLIVHCEIPGLSSRLGASVLDLVPLAQRVVFLTVSMPAEAMRERHAALKVAITTRFGWNFAGRRHHRLKQTLGNPERIAELYAAWSVKLRSAEPQAREIESCLDADSQLSFDRRLV